MKLRITRDGPYLCCLGLLFLHLCIPSVGLLKLLFMSLHITSGTTQQSPFVALYRVPVPKVETRLLLLCDHAVHLLLERLKLFPRAVAALRGPSPRIK